MACRLLWSWFWQSLTRTCDGCTRGQRHASQHFCKSGGFDGEKGFAICLCATRVPESIGNSDQLIWISAGITIATDSGSDGIDQNRVTEHITRKIAQAICCWSPRQIGSRILACGIASGCIRRSELEAALQRVSECPLASPAVEDPLLESGSFLRCSMGV